MGDRRVIVRLYSHTNALVGVPGIEPELNAPEACVIPLYHTPVYWCEGGTPAYLSTYRYYRIFTRPNPPACGVGGLCPEKCNGMNMRNAVILHSEA